MNDVRVNNTAELAGEIVSDFTFSHNCNGESFYSMYLRVLRKSGNSDTIPVMVSDRLVDVAKNCIGYQAMIVGQFRSHNNNNEGKGKLELFVFATEFHFGEKEVVNSVYLNGYICKPTAYRTTPFGREIADVLIAVNRPYNKSDYIPCILWGRNARYASKLEVGTHIQLEGRIQSREYIKKLDDGTQETRTAYEASVSRIDVAESEK